jgi:DNA-3-methyladenine glycosylase
VGDLEEGGVVERARALLGRTFTGHGVTVVLTEVEAYGGVEDPASHAFTRTPRSEIMYGPPGRLYVYRSYGIHHCANVVTGPTELAAAVLLRAGRVVDGLGLARSRRGDVDDVRLARGPGNLAQALGLTIADLGTPVTTGSGVGLGERVETPEVVAGPRVGVARAADVPWRFWVAGDATVSAYRRSPRAPRATARRPQ